ncbi:hypothetical protein [Microbacterium yannicii]|uniref:hypothetical protein n=1 Tax=Microbacterium yannicii TaxID=671622 RepID=UPI0002E2D320|nr:hypothetical protein [Microbacterium yannicii]
MGQLFDRRRFLSAGLLLTLGAATASCAPVPRRAVTTPSATPSPTPSPATAGGESTSIRPAVSTSYGPNGTHFPEDLPWLGEVAAVEVEAECDWVDIARVVKRLTREDVAAGVMVRVAPGELPGAGAKSSSQPALGGIGDPEWQRNVVICPRDGFGSVRIADAGIRLDQCSKLSFFGFVSEGGLALTQCTGVQIGWSRFSSANITRGGADLAFYELVLGFRQNPEDTAGLRPTESFAMTNISRHGCVFGPSVKPAGSDAHCDTVQLEGTGDGAFGPFVSVDCVDYGSSNAAMLLHDRLVSAEYRHCMVLGGQLPWRVYPLQPGDYDGDPNAFSGGCRDVRLHDSIVAGAVGRMGFTVVENSTLSYAPVASQQPSGSGRWKVDASIAGWSRDEIMSHQELADYDEASLAALWRW